ncbi:hypothetical protein [Curvivirga sp.]|uniref:hypothetical protein n=1 Tax=Curvivirga sp. TaxID=2856848 RepID=UPI003B59556B
MFIFSVLRKYLEEKSFLLSLKKIAPVSIPLSGPSVQDRNYNEIIIKQDEHNNFIVSHFQEDVLGGTILNLNSYERTENQTLNFEEALEHKITIVRYYKSWRFRYDTPIAFLRATILFLPRLTHFLRELHISLHGRRKLIENDYYKVLGQLIEADKYEADKLFTKHDVCSLFYKSSILKMFSHKDDWFYHPERPEAAIYFQKLLNSYVSEKLVQKMDNGVQYEILPAAYTIYAKHLNNENLHAKQTKLAEHARTISILIMLATFLNIFSDNFAAAVNFINNSMSIARLLISSII